MSTFVAGYVGMDAIHIKPIKGESSAELMPLVDVVERIKARAISLGERRPSAAPLFGVG